MSERLGRSRSPSGTGVVIAFGASKSASARRTYCAMLLLALTTLPCPAAEPAPLEQALAKVVKIYGAGGFQGLEAYQSGSLISADGYILTAWSYVLDTDYITAVLNDGRRFEAKLVGADPRLEIAVLKIQAEGLPCFDLGPSTPAASGQRMYALSNAFGVAQGNEPATVQEAVISIATTLAARRGVFETPYRGPVYIVDSVTNNAGATGGALVDLSGQLVAVLGKELKNTRNNTWLNYAIPVGELCASVDAIRTGKFVARLADSSEKKPENGQTLAALGLVLVPDVLERTPPYVDGIEPQSPAKRAGLEPDDLIVLVGDRLVQSCKSLVAELEYVDRDDKVTVTVLRGSELVEVTLTPNRGR